MRKACICLIIFFVIAGSAFGKDNNSVVEKGKEVSFEYILTVDGEVVDQSKEGGPMKYTHGKGDIIPGLERQLQGLQQGDERIITVLPEEAYGAINPEAFQEVNRSSLPQTVTPQVGLLLEGRDEEGRTFQGMISELKQDSVMVNFNHPLAGKTLFFKIKIVSIN